jgi:hypothetical protein
VVSSDFSLGHRGQARRHRRSIMERFLFRICHRLAFMHCPSYDFKLVCLTDFALWTSARRHVFPKCPRGSFLGQGSLPNEIGRRSGRAMGR